jgi:isopentenyl-diphosphate delta-isomerase
MQEGINLTDREGKRIGTMEKMAVHRAGALHEAFSIFVVNSKGEMMLQKRSKRKYHSGGLWSNTCCGHPREDEPLETAVHRRLREEMGFDCRLTEVFSFTYRIKFPNGLIEHEFDHVFLGRYERDPQPSKKEAMDWKWSTLSRIERDIAGLPEVYTHWFKLIFPRVATEIGARKKDLMLRDYVSTAEVMEDLYKVSHDFSDRWLHR